MRLAKPIVKKIEDNAKALKSFEATLSSEEKAKEIISSYPTVYIHNWKKNGCYEVYIGESNDIFQRTRQHYETGNKQESWQRELKNKSA